MKRFIIRLAVFAAIAVALDFGVGAAFSKIREMNRGGDVYRLNYILNEMTDDIVIMGSSRAEHHYDPLVMESVLKKPCFNCGFGGNGIIMQLAIWKCISNRYMPKVIIYDFNPDFDRNADFDNHRYLSRLKPFYRSNKEINFVFKDVDKTEEFKMCSNLFQYNSNCMDLLAGWIHPIGADNGRGFTPLYGEMTDIIHRGAEQNSISCIDELKLSYLKSLILETRGKCHLIFVLSPIYYSYSQEDLSEIKQMCDDNNIPFWDFSTLFENDVHFFRDPLHLNEEGAMEYSKYISNYLINQNYL